MVFVSINNSWFFCQATWDSLAIFSLSFFPYSSYCLLFETNCIFHKQNTQQPTWTLWTYVLVCVSRGYICYFYRNEYEISVKRRYLLPCGIRAGLFQSQSIQKVTFVQNSRVYSKTLYGLLFKYQVVMDWAIIISVTMKKREWTCRFYEIGFRILNIASNWNSSNSHCRLVLNNMRTPYHADI